MGLLHDIARGRRLGSCPYNRAESGYAQGLRVQNRHAEQSRRTISPNRLA